MVYTISHSFLAVLSRSTLFAIFSCLIRVYTICQSQQSNQGLHCYPFSAVWSRSTLFAFHSLIRVYTIFHSFWVILPSSTLFHILSSLIRVYTTCHSQQSDQGQDLHCHFQEQSDQGLHYLPFSAFWSGSTLLPILSSLIRVYTICHSQVWS